MKLIKVVVLLGLFLIVGCAEKQELSAQEFSQIQMDQINHPDEVYVTHEDDTFDKICKEYSGIVIGDDCNQVWHIRMGDDVDLEVFHVDPNAPPQYEESYWEQDDNLMICKPVNGSIELIECEPKRLWYTYRVQTAKVTYRNTTVDCYFINDSKNSQGDYCDLIIDKGCVPAEFNRVRTGTLYCMQDAGYNVCELNCYS